MFTPPVESVRAECDDTAAPGAHLHLVKDLPVAIRDLAAELDVTPAALHQQVRAGRLPAFKIRNTTFVTANIANQVREWLPANRFAAQWKVFTETPPDEGTDEEPES